MLPLGSSLFSLWGRWLLYVKVMWELCPWPFWVQTLGNLSSAFWPPVSFLLAEFVVGQSLSRVWLLATPWTAACQASLSFTISHSMLRLMSIESVMSSNHLILCHPLLLLPSIFPSIRIFSIEASIRELFHILLGQPIPLRLLGYKTAHIHSHHILRCTVSCRNPSMFLIPPCFKAPSTVFLHRCNFSLILFFFRFFFLSFYWRIIALQCYFGFCCVAKWIGYMCTYTFMHACSVASVVSDSSETP